MVFIRIVHERSSRTLEFQPLRKDQVLDVQEHERIIKIERKVANQSNFEIAPIVREHRGMNRQEDLERQRLIQEEVEKQLLRIQSEAYKEGFEKGLLDGQEEVFNQTRAGVEQKLESITEMIEEVLKTQEDLLAQEKMDVYRTIKNLTKWIVLKEIEQDGDYVVRLLDKLLNELQVKSNVLIQIDRKSFEDKPDILQMLEEKIGELKNVRLEIDYDIEGPGIVVTSENGIINGSLKEQFRNLSRLFESVGLSENESLEDVFDDGRINLSKIDEDDTPLDTAPDNPVEPLGNDNDNDNHNHNDSETNNHIESSEDESPDEGDDSES
jgi:flagellar assembly protein FliH